MAQTASMVLKEQFGILLRELCGIQMAFALPFATNIGPEKVTSLIGTRDF